METWSLAKSVTKLGDVLRGALVALDYHNGILVCPSTSCLSPSLPQSLLERHQSPSVYCAVAMACRYVCQRSSRTRRYRPAAIARASFLFCPLLLTFLSFIYCPSPFLAGSSSFKGDTGPDCDGGAHSRETQRSSLLGLLMVLSSQ